MEGFVKRCLNVGRTKDLKEKGFSLSEIAEKLKVTNEEVKEYDRLIENAEQKKVMLKSF